MENDGKHKRVGRWGPGGVVILALLVFWVKPAQTYYVCIQPDGTELLTDTPDANCVKQEESSPPLPSQKKPKESPGKGDAAKPEDTPEEQVRDPGHDKEWWQRRVRALKEEKSRISDQISTANKKLQTVPRNLPDSQKRKMKADIRKEMEGLREDLQRVDRELNQQLPEEARKAGVPSGWLR